MKIALIGYGRMGHEIEVVAVNRGHSINLIIDQENESDLNPENLKNVDVAIEFSFPDAAFNNIKKCLENKVPVVSGTTGWLDDYDKAAMLCLENMTSFIHSTNFSIGVNLLFRLNSELAGRMKQFNNYKVSIEEIHHTKKLDAPSGTAITLSDGICKNNPAYTGWCFSNDNREDCIPMTSVREGTVPGTHTVTWDSDIDAISLKHISKNRSGLAMGAVVAAEYIQSRLGIFTMNDVLGF
jgi:4-hydroxy-tetrahydrodipicolinate reductase